MRSSAGVKKRKRAKSEVVGWVVVGWVVIGSDGSVGGWVKEGVDREGGGSVA